MESSQPIVSCQPMAPPPPMISPPPVGSPQLMGTNQHMGPPPPMGSPSCISPWRRQGVGPPTDMGRCRTRDLCHLRHGYSRLNRQRLMYRRSPRVDQQPTAPPPPMGWGHPRHRHSCSPWGRCPPWDRRSCSRLGRHRPQDRRVLRVVGHTGGLTMDHRSGRAGFPQHLTPRLRPRRSGSPPRFWAAAQHFFRGCADGATVAADDGGVRRRGGVGAGQRRSRMRPSGRTRAGQFLNFGPTPVEVDPSLVAIGAIPFEIDPDLADTKPTHVRCRLF